MRNGAFRPPPTSITAGHQRYSSRVGDSLGQPGILSTGQPDPSSAKVPPILSKWNEPDVARSVAAGTSSADMPPEGRQSGNRSQAGRCLEHLWRPTKLATAPVVLRPAPSGWSAAVGARRPGGPAPHHRGGAATPGERPHGPGLGPGGQAAEHPDTGWPPPLSSTGRGASASDHDRRRRASHHSRAQPLTERHDGPARRPARRHAPESSICSLP